MITPVFIYTPEQLREMYQAGTLDPRFTSKATRKGRIHLHNPAAKPSRGRITPAEYRRRTKAANRARK